MQPFTNHPSYDSEVVVVGGGPVGMGLAIDLALRGVTVTVVEQHLAPQRIPKGQNLTQRTGEHFRAWGISEAIRAASPIPASFGNEGLTAYGSFFSGYHYDWFKRATVRPYYAADNERLPQYETERVLRERAAQLDAITMLLGWRCTDLNDAAHAVSATIEDRDSGTRRSLRARFLVGCDGARSRVRQAAGLSETVDARDRRMALLVFRSTALHELLEAHFPGKTIFNALHPDLGGYWQFLGRVDLNGGWFFHAPVPDSARVESFDFKALVYRAVGREFELDFEHIGLWDLRFTQADQYGSGRVFIAGDAAHSHPPYGGYGVNVGFEDARNLAWKLAATLRGWGGDRLLGTYGEERHPVFASTRDNFIARMIEDDAAFTAAYDPATDCAAFEAAWKQRASGGQNEVATYLPNYAGSSIVWGTPGAKSGAVGQHSHRALAGHHLAPARLSDGTSSHDRLGPAFTLIDTSQSPDIDAAFAAAARDLRVPLEVMTTVPTKETARWRAPLILLRPDGFVAFAGYRLPVSARELLGKAVGIG